MNIEEEVLNLLSENARLSIEDMAMMTKCTQEEISETIKKLQDNGVILKFATIINPEKKFYEKSKVHAEIELQCTLDRESGFDEIAERIYHFPQVNSLYLMSGGYDLKIIIEGDSLQDVANFVSSKLATLPGIRSTKTTFILKTYKEKNIIYVANKEDSREEVSS